MAVMTESWTDQRVASLKKLWQQGKSASEIAESLGGVTRNAVIGKAHRLGLSGRPSPIKTVSVKKPAATAPKSAAKPATPAKKPAPAAKPAVKAAPPAKSTVASAVKAAAAAPQMKKPAPAPIAAAAPAKKPESAPQQQTATAKSPFNLPMTAEVMARPLMVHDGKVISILELSEKTCRWPIGDPKDPAFGYCGAIVHPTFPYCPGHVVMAFQSSRKDGKKVANDIKVDEAGVPEDIEVDDIEVADGEEEMDDALDDEADDAAVDLTV